LVYLHSDFGVFLILFMVIYIPSPLVWELEKL
jgi:hypothetical protein